MRKRIKSLEERIAYKYAELHGTSLNKGLKHVKLVELKSNLRYITEPHN